MLGEDYGAEAVDLYSESAAWLRGVCGGQWSAFDCVERVEWLDCSLLMDSTARDDACGF